MLRLSYFIDNLRQRHRVAFGKLADTASKGMRDAVQLAVHRGGEGGEPFVVNNKRLDFVFGEFRIFGIELSFQNFLRGFQSGFCISLARK
jgi:hypothetical protein